MTPTRTGESLLQKLSLGSVKSWGWRGKRCMLATPWQPGLASAHKKSLREVEFSLDPRKTCQWQFEQNISHLLFVSLAALRLHQGKIPICCPCCGSQLLERRCMLILKARVNLDLLFSPPAMGTATKIRGTTARRCPTAPRWTQTTTGWGTNVTTMMTMMGSQMRNLQAPTTAGSSLTLPRKTRTVREAAADQLCGRDPTPGGQHSSLWL